MDFLNSEWERGFYVLIALIALATFVIFAWFARRYIRPSGFSRYAAHYRSWSSAEMLTPSRSAKSRGLCSCSVSARLVWQLELRPRT